MTIATQNACTNQDFNTTDQMKGFLIAIENDEEFKLFLNENEGQAHQYTPVAESLASQMLSWISEADFATGSKTLAEDDYNLMDAVDLVEPFYLEFFTQNRMEILKHLCSDLDSEECLENAWKQMLWEIGVYDNFESEHVKVAFLSPKHTTVEELDDVDIFDNAYFYTAEFASAMIARSIACAYNNYLNL
jgi:hypothetical protein